MKIVLTARVLWVAFALLLVVWTTDHFFAASGPVPPPPVQGSANLYARFLTVADVEKITGLQGLRRRENRTALTFLEEDQAVLQATFDAAASWKSFEEKDAYAPLDGLGVPAALARSQNPDVLAFVKGERCVSLKTFAKEGAPGNRVTKEQLVELAKLLAGRM